jgi:hypothetical protein
VVFNRSRHRDKKVVGAVAFSCAASPITVHHLIRSEKHFLLQNYHCTSKKTGARLHFLLSTAKEMDLFAIKFLLEKQITAEVYGIASCGY